MTTIATTAAPITAPAEVVASNREAWLAALAYRLVVDIMEPAGYGHHADLRRVKDGIPMVEGKTYEDDELELVPLTEQLKISCSWPSSGGVAKRKRTIGECWGNMASVGNYAELFISPTLDAEEDNGVQLAGVVVHELLHAAMPQGTKHGRRFAKGCARLGLDGKPTATAPGDELKDKLFAILLGLPPYPHARIVARPKLKSEKSRMHKVFCVNEACSSAEDGGFKFRLTRTWVEQLIAGEDADGDTKLVMDCPFCNKGLVVELPEEGE